MLLPLAAALCCALSAGDADLRKVDLFEARQGGYHTYRIPGIAATPRGALLAYCEARRTGTGDWEDIDIVLRRSRDGGATWTEPRVLVDAGPQPAHNATTLIDAQSGAVHFLYCVNYARAFHMVSTNDGETFSPPVEITGVFEQFHKEFLWNVIATGPGHGIQLRRGRMIVPVWISNGGKRHRPSAASVIYSDDRGRSWHRGDIVPVRMVNMSETVAVELSDGSVMLNIRSEDRQHRRVVTTSRDGARRWSAPGFDESLLEPICMASILRLNYPAQGEPGRILFCNPDNLEYSGKHGASYDQNRDRKRLTLKLSLDDAKTWPISRVLEPGVAAYSDLAIDGQGRIYCIYERDGVNGSMWDTRYVTVARLNLAWLTAPPARAPR